MKKTTSNVVTTIALGALFAGIVGTVGCGPDEKTVEGGLYKDVASCVQDQKNRAQERGTALVTGDEDKLIKACTEMEKQAKEEHARSAPRYESLADCQADYGVNACGPVGGSSGGSNNSFIPFYLGYMMGSSRSGSTTVYVSRPFYRSAAGEYVTPSGHSLGSSLGRTTISESATVRSTAPTTFTHSGYQSGTKLSSVYKSSTASASRVGTTTTRSPSPGGGSSPRVSRGGFGGGGHGGGGSG